MSQRRFVKGSKAWRRAALGEARRCQNRALKVVQRAVSAHGFQAVLGERPCAGTVECVDVYAVPMGRLKAPFPWVYDDLPFVDGAVEFGGRFIFDTRTGMRAAMRDHCRHTSERHWPACDCESCLEVPF